MVRIGLVHRSRRSSPPASSRRWGSSPPERPPPGPPRPQVVLIVGPAGAATNGYRAEARAAAAVARKYTPRRHRGLLPQRDLAGGQGRAPGRVAGRLHGPRQRLAEPYRDALYPPTQNGFGLNPSRRRAATTRISTTGRGGSRRTSSSPRTRSCCSTTSATPAACPSPACPKARSPWPSSASTTSPAGFVAAGADAVIAEAYARPSGYVKAILGGGIARSIRSGAPPRAPTATSFAFESAPQPRLSRPDGPRASRASGFERSIVLKRGLVPADVRAGARGAPRGPFVADPLLRACSTPASPSARRASRSDARPGRPLTLSLPFRIADRGRLPERLAASLRWRDSRPRRRPTPSRPRRRSTFGTSRS